MGRMLKWGGGLLALVVLGWSAFWYIGARGQEAGLAAWLDTQRARGWQAEAAGLEILGYPFDFKLDVTELSLADPKTGWAWSAPKWIAESKPWAPTRVAVTWPNEQVVATPEGRADVTSTKMISLVDLRPGPSMELRQVTSEIEALRVLGAEGWQAGADTVSLNIAERPEDLGPDHAYDLQLSASKVELPKEAVAQLDPTGWLEPAVDSLTVSGHAAFRAPLDRFTVEEGRLALTAATIREAGFQWGDMRLVVKGSVVVDEQGYPKGDIRIEADEWRQMVRLAVSSGLIDQQTARSVTQAIQFVTSLTGTGDSLSLPLGLSGGKVRIGPFAIADAPRLAPPL